MVGKRCAWCAGFGLHIWLRCIAIGWAESDLEQRFSELNCTGGAEARAHALLQSRWHMNKSKEDRVHDSHPRRVSVPYNTDRAANTSRLLQKLAQQISIMEKPSIEIAGPTLYRRLLWGSVSVVSLFQIVLVLTCIKDIEGRDLAQKIAPVASAASLCVVVNACAERLGKPWNHFSATTALITVVFVMDMGTFERFVIKVTLRGLGTVLGGVLAIIGAELAEISNHHVMVPTSFVFVVFISDSLLAKRFGYISYTFTMTSVTFALVFFGYVRRGWDAILQRFLSVFVGEVIAVFCALVSSTLLFRHGSSSIVTLIRKSQEIFEKALVAIDFAFIRNHICSAVDDESVLQVLQLSIHKEVEEWYRYHKEPSASELRELAKSTVFHDLPIDVSVSVLQTECRTLWSDMVFLRKVFPCRRVFNDPPNFCTLPERAHPLFVQASALAHSSMIEPLAWQSFGLKLEGVRVQLQLLHKPFVKIFKYKIESIKSGSSKLRSHSNAVLAVIWEVASCLQQAQTDLKSVREQLNNEEVRRNGVARFHGFCHGLNLVIADLSSLAITCLRLMEVPVDASSEAVSILSECAGMDHEDIHAQNELTDISKSDLIKHWARVQALIPQHGRAPIDEGEE